MSETLSSPLLVVVEPSALADEPVGSAASLKLLEKARELTTGPVVVLNLGDPQVAQELGKLGADRVLVPNTPGFSPRVPQAVADAIEAALGVVGEEVGAILIPSTYVGRAAGATVATRDGLGIGVDVTGITVEDERLSATKSALSATWETEFTSSQSPVVLAVRPGVGPTEETPQETPRPGGAIESEDLEFELSTPAAAVAVDSSAPCATGERVSLAQADIAVVAGRGIDGDTAMVEELADALGAGIGATRVVCDEGWLPRSAQIGQTGVSIAPRIYLGLGVSGAVHHASGMLASQNIVAVVDDPDAPIAQIADLTVVGDVQEVVPQLLEALAQN